MTGKIRRNARKVRYVLYRETLIDWREHLVTFVGAFLGIGIIGYLHAGHLMPNDAVFLIGSFGASSVLVFGIVHSPLAQPRNLVGGHLVSALVGVTVYKLIPGEQVLAASTAVALSIVMMQITKTLHPPGGATALIAVIGSEKVKAMGYLYVLSPVLTGVLILFITAVFCSRLMPDRVYPSHEFRLFWKRGNWLAKRRPRVLQGHVTTEDEEN
jgi:CBS domain-containing membrane protein